MATRQNEAYHKANPDVGGSQIVHSARGASGSRGQASSPHVGGGRDWSVNSGRDKQMQTYNPEYAEKQLAGQAIAGQGKSSLGPGN